MIGVEELLSRSITGYHDDMILNAKLAWVDLKSYSPM